MMEYEPFIMTVSGKKVTFRDPQDSQIDIKDIAFALANQCRFNGHISFYSVAEHSVAVASRLPHDLQLAGLLHDASEAYLSDIPSPIKQFLPDYLKMEETMQAAINKKYNVDTLTSDIKYADKDALHTEAFYLMNNPDWIPAGWRPNKKWAKPACLPPVEAYKLFMAWYNDLTKSIIALPDKTIVLV
jgi:hypothetical protein